MEKDKKEKIEIQCNGSAAGGKYLTIGVEQSLENVFSDLQVPENLKSALMLGVTWQEREEYTVEKSLLSPGLASQWIGALLSLGSSVTLEGDIEATLSDYLLRKASNAKLISIRIPFDVPGRRFGNAHVGITPADVPIVSAFVTVDFQSEVVKCANIALTGVWKEFARLSTAVDLIVGKKLTKDLIAAVSQAVFEEVTPKADYKGSVSYRREMAKIMVRRSLEACMKGAE